MTAQSEIKTISQEPGINDLPGMIKVLFAKAVQLERAGNDAAAAEYLDKALAAEERNRTGA